jgi:hypothetical protein
MDIPTINYHNLVNTQLMQEKWNCIFLAICLIKVFYKNHICLMALGKVISMML